MAKPGLLRVVVGAFVFVGAAGALDQQALVQAPVSTALLISSALMVWRGARRMELGAKAVAVPAALPVPALLLPPVPLRRVKSARLRARVGVPA